MCRAVFFWRRTDVEGLERLELLTDLEGVTATTSVICLAAGGFRLDHRWCRFRFQWGVGKKWRSRTQRRPAGLIPRSASSRSNNSLIVKSSVTAISASR